MFYVIFYVSSYVLYAWYNNKLMKIDIHEIHRRQQPLSDTAVELSWKSYLSFKVFLKFLLSIAYM